jgi:hypothetical protein
MTPTELWLPIGAAGFYLYDSTCLLWQNELLYTRRSSDWQVAGGSNLRLAGRRVMLPNPFTPHRLQYLVRWSLTDPRTAANDAAPAHLLQQLRPLRVLAFAMMLMLLVALPAISWTLGAGLTLLLLFAAYYASLIVALVLLYRRRQTLQMAGRAYWAFALDVFLCAPFALNIVRRVSMRTGIAGDPLAFAARQFDAGTLTQTRELVQQRLAEEDAGRAPDADRQQRIAQLLNRLKGAAT